MKKYIVHYTEYDGERENLMYSAISLDDKQDIKNHSMILSEIVGEDDEPLVLCPVTDRYELSEDRGYYQYTLDDIRPITEEHLRIINKYIYI